MQKKIYIFFTIIIFYNQKLYNNSNTFIFINPAYQSNAIQKSGSCSSFFDTHHEYAFQITGAHQHAIHTKQFQHYFLPTDKTELIIGQTNSDINPSWIALPSSFTGTLTINPQQHSEHILFEISRSLGALCKNTAFNSFLKNIRLFALLPITYSSSHINLEQHNIKNAGPDTDNVHDITSAFKNSSWNFSKIDNEPDKIRLAEIRIGLGTTFIGESDDYVHLATSTAISIPLHTKQNPNYLFSPQIGFNGHIAFISDASLQFPITPKNKPNTCCAFLNLTTTFLMKNNAWRTFDLNNKEWSRFIMVRKKGENAIPGVNFFTQNVTVNPYSIIDITSGLRYIIKDRIELECGFGARGNQKESIIFNNNNFGEYGIAGSTNNNSASTSTIKTISADDSNFITIKQSDINENSGSSPSRLTYRAHGSFSYHRRSESRNVFITSGASLDIPHNHNIDLFSIALWFKLGGAF